MADQPELENLYREAQSALKSRDYVRASELLRQILVIDENYKDVSRLLAQTVKLKRRRWYNDPRLWGTLGFVVIVALGFFIAPRLKGLYAIQPTAPVVINSPTATLVPTISPTATPTLLPSPTPIPLTWKRISMGQEFELDTVSAIVTDPNDPDVIYAGLMHAGVYKSIDGGLAWKPTHQGLTNTEVRSLLIDPQNPGILYAGTNGKTFKTTDGGEHWEKTSGNGAYLLMDPQDSSHLYARGEDAGIYESFNSGKSWSSISSIFNSSGAIGQWVFDPVDGKTLYLSHNDNRSSMPRGIYTSIDGGLTWKLMENLTNYGGRFVVGRDAHENTVIYAYDYPQLQISYSGGSWSGKNFWCESMSVDSSSPGTAYCLLPSGKMTGTNDGGHTWRSISSPNLDYINVMNVDSINGSDRIIAAGSGLYISADTGVSWTEGGNGLAKTLSQLKIDPQNNTTIYLTTYYGLNNKGCTIYRSQNSGQSWSSIMERHNWSWCGITIDAGNFLFASNNGKLLRSSDNGSTWNSVAVLPGNVDRDSIQPYLEDRIFANPYIPGLMYDVSWNTNSIYYSTNSGASWNKSGHKITYYNTLYNAYMYYAGPDEKTIYVFPYKGYRLADDGKWWIQCADIWLINDSETRVAVDPRDGKHLFAATRGDGVHISTDGCKTWRKKTNEDVALFVNSIAIDPNHPDIIYAGTQAGAFVSFDDGASWHEINDGLLGATVVYSIAVDKDSNVYAATPYGIFKLESK